MSVVGNATRRGMNVSAAARAAIARAIDELQPHVGEDPRLEALASKLAAIRSPEDDFAKNDRLADQLVDVAKAEHEADVSSSDLCSREAIRKATVDAQARYLREVSPAAYEAWRQHAEQAGRL